MNQKKRRLVALTEGMVAGSGDDSNKADEGREGRWVARRGAAAPAWGWAVLDDGVGQEATLVEFRRTVALARKLRSWTTVTRRWLRWFSVSYKSMGRCGSARRT